MLHVQIQLCSIHIQLTGCLSMIFSRVCIYLNIHPKTNTGSLPAASYLRPLRLYQTPDWKVLIQRLVHLERKKHVCFVLSEKNITGHKETEHPSVLEASIWREVRFMVFSCHGSGGSENRLVGIENKKGSSQNHEIHFPWFFQDLSRSMKHTYRESSRNNQGVLFDFGMMISIDFRECMRPQKDLEHFREWR